MGLFSRMTAIVKAKMSKVLDAAEDPRETLDYSYERQLEQLQQVKRGLADVVASKKRIELQVAKVRQNAEKLEEQAKQALAAGREDLARAALERKQVLLQQLEGFEAQVAQLEQEQEKMTMAESRLRAKVEAFRTQKEVIKAQYSAAEAQVKIGEAATGLSEELTDVSLAVQRAMDKTESMKARAAAIDELVAAGTLEDVTGGDPIEAELKRISASQGVESDLERLKKEVGGK